MLEGLSMYTEGDQNKSPLILPSLDFSFHSPKGKHGPESSGRFKPVTCSLSLYNVVPPIGSPINEFKNYNTEVWETLQKIRAEEKKLPGVVVRHCTDTENVRLTVNTDPDRKYVSSSFEMKDIGKMAIPKVEKDLPEVCSTMFAH